MASCNDDSLELISVQLNGKNYSYWEYVMKNFLLGKSMWGYVTGARVKPTDQKAPEYAESLDIWEIDNSKIITWINNSIAHYIGVQLAKYETAKEVWDHLTRLYSQKVVVEITNSSLYKKYQLETDIRALQQKYMNVQDFYFAMSELWDQLDLIESTDLRAFPAYIVWREEQRLIQFLMALRNDFEGLRRTILHRIPLPSVDSVVSELLVEEIRLNYLINKGTAPTTLSVFQCPKQNRSHTKVSHDECAFCKQKGHWKAQCPLLLSNNKPQNTPWRPVNQSSQWTYRLPQSSNATPLSSNAVTTPSLDPYMFEQFQRFLTSQPHSISVVSHKCLSSSSGDSGHSINESDWDRP